MEGFGHAIIVCLELLSFLVTIKKLCMRVWFSSGFSCIELWCLFLLETHIRPCIFYFTCFMSFQLWNFQFNLICMCALAQNTVMCFIFLFVYLEINMV